LAGVGLGFPLAVYAFVGWENSATLAEETETPRKNIPRALVIGTLAIGVVYVFLAYATEIAFHNDARAIGDSTIPFIDGLKASGAGLLIIAYLAGMASIFSCLLGLTNSQARILFSAGREGLLQVFFGKMVLTLFPLWGLVQPGQPAPFNLFPAMTGVGLVLSIIYGIILARRSPDLVRSIGSYVKSIQGTRRRTLRCGCLS
jgi:amino acid transporter